MGLLDTCRSKLCNGTRDLTFVEGVHMGVKGVGVYWVESWGGGEM